MEVASLQNGVGVRDSKDKKKSPFVFSPESWTAFVTSVKANHFE